jgi:hypothetical protein
MSRNVGALSFRDNRSCNGLRSVLQLSDDDSTSITKLEEREGKAGKNGYRIAVAFL